MQREGIGGSDSPTILGVNPYQDVQELWEIKTGRREQPQENAAMQRGKILEPVAAELYATKTGRKLRRVNMMQRHPDHEWMTGNFDREIVGEDKGPGILEIKCPGLQIFGKAKREGLPASYNVQLQHYLAVSGRQWGAFAVFNSEKWDLIFFDINRDDELINLIIAKDAEFYQAVLNDQKPIITIPEIKDLPPVEPTEFVSMNSTEWKEAIERLREAKEIRAEAEALEKEAVSSIQNLMIHAGASVAEGAGARIYWRLGKGRTTLDSKGLQKDHPEIFAKYQRTGNPIKYFKPYFLKEVAA